MPVDEEPGSHPFDHFQEQGMEPTMVIEVMDWSDNPAELVAASLADTLADARGQDDE